MQQRCIKQLRKSTPHVSTQIAPERPLTMMKKHVALSTVITVTLSMKKAKTSKSLTNLQCKHLFSRHKLNCHH